MKCYLSFLLLVFISQRGIGQKLGFHELSAGVDARQSHFYKWQDQTKNLLASDQKNAQYLGVSARFVTSFLATCYAQKITKWRIVDVLTGELGFGAAQSTYEYVKGGFFPTYDFSLGFGGIYRINDKQDIGLNFGLLRFARSLQSKNFSGCNVFLRYRYDRIFLDLGLDSWYEFYFTWIYIFNDRYNPIQVTACIKYAFNGKQLVGVRLENNTLYSGKPHLTSFGKEEYWNIRVFYGIYF